MMNSLSDEYYKFKIRVTGLILYRFVLIIASLNIELNVMSQLNYLSIKFQITKH